MCRLLSPSGVDCQVKVWDVRTFKPLHAYFANSPATSLDISQRGLLAVGQGRRLQVRAVLCFVSVACVQWGVASLASSPATSLDISQLAVGQGWRLQARRVTS